ncbi:MAG: rhodanese-like domain-containing protein [Phycisphaerales bacterium]
MTGSFDEQGLPAGYPFKPSYEVSPRRAAEMMASGEALLVDVRLAEELDVASLPGVADHVHAPLHELNDHLDDIEDAANGRPILTLCHHGVRSIKAALALRGCGFEGALSIAGGIENWSLAIDPSVPRYLRDGAHCTLVE